jgi:catechol 2,3-dioxygenase-like lactoylglutathione lyase family enzyme
VGSRLGAVKGGKMGVLRLGYLEVRVKDLLAATHYYTQVVGLRETDRVNSKVYLKAWDEQEHHQLVLVEDAAPGLNYMAFRLEDPDDLERFEDKLERNEYRVRRVSAGDEHALGEAIRFTAPSEHQVELYYDMRLVGNGLPTTNPDPYPDGLQGIHPPRMDHTLLSTPDTPDASPTRHGIRRGHTIYFFDPSGNRNEVFTGGYWADPKMEPITWTADKLWQGIFYWDRVEKGAFVANYT